MEPKLPNDSQKPLPVNQRFPNLDAYLLWMEQNHGSIGKPWYREVRPGVYELVGGNLRVLSPDGKESRDERQTYTREQLERKFGFGK